MEQILLGLVLYNAFFQPSDLQYDTFEIGQVQFEQNKETELDFDSDFQSLQGLSLGSRGYSQATSWLRYGHGTYIYGHKSESTDGLKKLNHYGGYAGLLAEVHYKQYFGVGALFGGGASYTEYQGANLPDNDRSHYYLLASPYITIGLPLTNTASINLTASTFIMSEPREQIDGGGEGFEAPHDLENKVGLEFVWSWD
jgi:hypothetical protein